MPRTLKTDWTETLKATLKSKGVPRGWSVTKSGAKVRLRVRQGSGGKDSWTKTLPNLWEIGCIGPVSDLLVGLHELVDGGATLDEAWAQLHPEEAVNAAAGTPNPITGINWRKIQQGYLRDRERNGTKVGAKSLASDTRYTDVAVDLLTGPDAPTTGYKLLDLTVDKGGWTDKARARQQCVDAVVRMLTYAIDNEGLDPSWTIRQSQKLKVKGDGKPAEDRPIKELSDAQIIELLDSAAASKAPAWRNVLLVMSVYGLRPEELRHLEVKANPSTKKDQLFCSYQKACGGKAKKTETKPRFLYPWPPRDAEGNEICSDLTAAFKGGLLPFPAMGRGSIDMNQFLNRNAVWKRIKAEAEAEGKWLRPYSFRNSYSVRCHAQNIPSSLVADAMGHSDLTHNAFYLTATADATSKAFGM